MAHLPTIKDIRAIAKPFPRNTESLRGEEYEYKIEQITAELVKYSADIPAVYNLEDLKTQPELKMAVEQRTLLHGQRESYRRILDRIQLSHRDTVHIRREDPLKTDLYRVLSAGHQAVTAMPLPYEFHRFYFGGALRMPTSDSRLHSPTRPFGTLEDLWQNMIACGFLVPPTQKQLDEEGIRDLLLDDDQICTYALRILSRYIRRWLPMGVWTGMNEARFKAIIQRTLNLHFSQDVYPLMERYLKFDPAISVSQGNETVRYQRERSAWLNILGEYYALVCVAENTPYTQEHFTGMYDKFIDFCTTSLKDSVEARLDAFLVGRITFSESDYGRYCGDRAVCEIAQLLDAPKGAEGGRLLDVLTVDHYLGYEFVHWIGVTAKSIPRDYSLMKEAQERQTFLSGGVREKYPDDVAHAKVLKVAFQRLNLMHSGMVNVDDARIVQVLKQSRFHDFLVGYKMWARRVFLFPYKTDTDITPEVLTKLEEQGGVQIVPREDLPIEPITPEIALEEAEKRMMVARLLGRLDWKYWSKVPGAMSIIRAGGTPELIAVEKSEQVPQSDGGGGGEEEGGDGDGSENDRPLKRQAIENAQDMDEPTVPSPLPVSVTTSVSNTTTATTIITTTQAARKKVQKSKKKTKGKKRTEESSMQVLVNPREFKVITNVEIKQPKLPQLGMTRWELMEKWQSSTVDFTIIETAVYRENSGSVPAPTGASILEFMQDMRNGGYIVFPVHTRQSKASREESGEPYIFTHYEWEDMLLQMVRDITKMKDKWLDLLYQRIGILYARWNELSKASSELVAAGDPELSKEGREVSTRLGFILNRLTFRLEKNMTAPARVELYLEADTAKLKKPSRGKREASSAVSTEDGDGGGGGGSADTGDGEDEEEAEEAAAGDGEEEDEDIVSEYTSEDLRTAYHPFTTLQWYELYHRVVHSQIYAYSAARREEAQERRSTFFDGGGGGGGELMAEEEDRDPVVVAIQTSTYKEEIPSQTEVNLLITRVGPAYVTVRSGDEGPIYEPVQPPRRYLIVGAGVRSASFQQYVLQRLRDVSEASLYAEYTYEGRTAEQWYQSFGVSKSLYDWVYSLYTDTDMEAEDGKETVTLDPETMDSIVQTMQAFAMLRDQGRVATSDLPLPQSEVWSVLNAGVIEMDEDTTATRLPYEIGYNSLLAIPGMDGGRHIGRRLYEMIYMRYAMDRSDMELLIQGGEEANHLDTLWRMCQLIFTRVKSNSGDIPRPLVIHGEKYKSAPEQRRGFTYWAVLFLGEHGRDISFPEFGEALFGAWGPDGQEWTVDNLVAMVESLRDLLTRKAASRRAVGGTAAVTMIETAEGEIVPVQAEMISVTESTQKEALKIEESTFFMIEGGAVPSSSMSTVDLGKLAKEWKTRYKRAVIFNGTRSQREKSPLWPTKKSFYEIWKGKCEKTRGALRTDPGYNGDLYTKLFALLFVYQWMVPRNVCFMIKCFDSANVVTRATLNNLLVLHGIKDTYGLADATGDDGTSGEAVLTAVNTAVTVSSTGSPVKSPTKPSGDGGSSSSSVSTQRQSPPSTPVSRPSKSHGKDEA